VRTKVTPSRQAIATMSTGDVSLSYHKIALCESFHMIAYIVDNADELMADCHRHRNRFLRPRVPVENVNTSSANRGFQNAKKNASAATSRNRKHPQAPPRLRPGLHESFHHSLHDGKLGQSGSRETKFVGRQSIGQP